MGYSKDKNITQNDAKQKELLKDKYVDNYLGKGKEKVINDNYSFMCLIGPAYALYCNMGKIGFPWMITEGLLLYLVPLKFSIIIVVAINIIFGFIFNELYLKDSLKQIEKIKETTKSSKEINKKSLKRGKKSITMLILSIIIYILFGIAIMMRTESFKIVDDLIVQVPINFAEETSYGSYRAYKFNDEKNSCYIDITSFEPGKQTAENYLNSQTHEEGSEISGLEKEKINGKIWYKVEETTKKGYKLYYYATENKKRIYSVKYTIYKDSGACSNIKNKIYNSLRF
ncbi:MAG: hypothetical protein IKJ43_00795 [Bacilli bacterium]|nr:hypothetical protein [Bacilli bacterium]